LTELVETKVAELEKEKVNGILISRWWACLTRDSRIASTDVRLSLPWMS
jgi:hypothetical protein